MQTEFEPIESCMKCGSAQALNFKFCTRCGIRNPEKIKIEKKKDESYQLNISYLSAYTIISLILLVVAAFTEDTLALLIIWTVAFALVDVVFAFLQPSVWAFVWPKKIEFKPTFFIVVIGITTGFIVTFLMDNMNLVLFEETFVYMPYFIDSKNPLLLAIIFMAVCPAIFEELAFRGFVFNNIKGLAGKTSAIWGSAFLFGLVHFSLLSLIWIIPFGLILAYFRNRYSTIFYGIIGHFIHNATTILIEYYELI